MSDTTQKSFMGIPIIGEIDNTGAEQRGEEEFARDVQSLLAFPLIESFGWRQYTPYFNDGDTCTFNVHGFWVRTVMDVDAPAAECRRCGASCPVCDENDEDDTDKLEISAYQRHPVLGGRESYRNTTYVGTHEAEWMCAENLWRRLDGGEYNGVLLKLFGDHALLKITRDKIQRDSYDHD